MTKTQAEKQLETFFRRLGIKASFFKDKNFVIANVGEVVLGFEFIENEEKLKTKALIYRFRNAPKPEILNAIFAEASEAISGGGQIFFDKNELSLFLEKDFTENLDTDIFRKQVNILAQASLFWSNRKLRQIAEKAG